MRKLLTYIILFLAIIPCGAQKRTQIVRDFTPVCDSLSVLMRERTGVNQKLRTSQIMKRGNYLDFYFDLSLSDIPLRSEDYAWLRRTLQGLFPDKYEGQQVGEIYSVNEKMTDLIVAPLSFDGSPISVRYHKDDSRGRNIVVPLDGQEYVGGLSGRHIAIWPSHGLYYDRSGGKWRWQRPVLFQTVEDLLSTSFVLPYLVPMIENAGGYVMLPRERDVNPIELVIDNDFSQTTRSNGIYAETGGWSDAGTGFADDKEVYVGEDNPFTLGTARETRCVPDAASQSYARAVWTPDFPKRDFYAVYVSYKTVPESTDDARYTVNHLGGSSSFSVNQTMGGGTWVYLGTFEFGEGTECSVELDNVSSGEGVVTADAVKIGGGMGNVAGSITGDRYSVEETSGLPRYTEAARYWLQWAGIPAEVYSQHELKNDYRDDLFSRGDWVEYLSGGSEVNPKMKGAGIPFDLTLAFHTDAGVTSDDTVIGSLAIYTRKNEWRDKLPDGTSRATDRELADIVQSQLVNDIQASFDSTWVRRQIWNRGYRETRTPPTPALLTESLSHQNFADMRFALDPSFKFTLSRAVYKGILKYLSARYGCPYVVQPLPVHSFAAVPSGDNRVRLSWMPRIDSMEETAVAKEYMLYTRVNDGAFDNGIRVAFETTAEGRVYTDVAVIPGNIYSFKVTALNEGGESFPSEILAVGLPSGSSFGGKYVAVVNDFTRVSAPVWYDSKEYAGFNNLIDSGVPYIRDIAYTGEIYNNERSSQWQTDENSGFGASFNDHSGYPVAGNTFDFVYKHGQAIMEAGVPFCSMSAEAFASSFGNVSAHAIDIICGKQVTTITGGKNGSLKYEVFPEDFQTALSSYASAGGHILVSGSHIGTDIWDRVYPIQQRDEAAQKKSIKFAESVFGFRWSCNNAGHSGAVKPVLRAGANISEGSSVSSAGASSSSSSVTSSSRTSATVSSKSSFLCNVTDLQFNTQLTDYIYKVEAPDGLSPASSTASSIFRYADSNNTAAVSYIARDGHRAVSFGFPLETITSEENFNSIITSTLRFFGL